MQTGSAAEIAEALRGTGYLADDALATVTFLALRMQRPLLVEGEPGTGKTALAEAIAESLDLPLIRLQCYEGIDATQALYDWDFPRQILHLRALEAAGTAATASASAVLPVPGSPSSSSGRCMRSARNTTVARSSSLR